MGSSCRIECIFFSEFHPTLGPKITYQVPSTLPGMGEEGDAFWSSAGRLEGLWVPVSPFTDNLEWRGYTEPGLWFLVWREICHTSSF